MENSDRRQVRRYIANFPVSFRLDSESELQYAEIVDISSHGICISATHALEAGTVVSVFLKLPHEVVGKESPEWRYRGSVVGMRPVLTRRAGDSRGSYGIEIKFGTYEIVDVPKPDFWRKGATPQISNAPDLVQSPGNRAPESPKVVQRFDMSGRPETNS